MADEEEEEEEARGALIPSFSSSDEPGSDSGCTAVLALLRDNQLLVANAGDSRCVVCRDGQAIEMSMDHKPDDDPERERIQKAGGQVTSDGRVNGGLNLSRAIGDHSYKRNPEVKPEEQMITALPDVKVLELKPEEDEFVVLACDGI
ncbi:PPM1G [Cordylochernes scorpioides]|uniref:protein-serine/threonine phosphatase n=1 Tax=Cordylochernes scorpioides TaxID=51811 RepID=A0ABY6KPG9_9ARAC|nr:PPM1G [Cordylochernes scorpioides]